MKVIGITGGIGAGKSTVVDYITCNYNAYAIVIDFVRASIMMPGGRAYYDIINAYGNDILADEIIIDRNKLYARVFNSDYELKKI